MAFFEQIGKKLTDAGQTVAQQTRNLADVTQLNASISEKEKEATQLILQIGNAYYNANKDNSEVEYADKIALINAIYDAINENREKIKQIKGVTKCPTCGKDVPLSASFCNNCGSRICR